MCHAKHARGGAQPVSLRFIRRKRERARTRATRAVSPYFKMAPRVTRVFVFLRRYIYIFFPSGCWLFLRQTATEPRCVFPPCRLRALPLGASRGRGGKPPSPNVGRRLGCLWRGRHSGRRLLADKRLEMLLGRHTEVATQLRQFNCYSETSWYITIQNDK